MKSSAFPGRTAPGFSAIDQIGDGGHHVLAVVDEEQDITFGEPVRERLFVRLATRSRQPELRGDFGRNELRGPHRAEPDDGHAVRKVRGACCRDEDTPSFPKGTYALELELDAGNPLEVDVCIPCTKRRPFRDDPRGAFSGE